MNKQPSVKEFRHNAEMPLSILGYALTAVVTIGAVIALISGIILKEWTTPILIGLASPFIGLFFVRYMYYKKISNGIKLTDKQLPELYKIYKELALKMGFKDGTENPIPEIYLINGNGVMNAFASKCSLYSKYIVLHSDIVDIAYGQNNFEALKFIMAHELGHILCKHIELKRLIVAPIMTLLFLNKSLTRAQEYTADRVALYYASEGSMSMIYLFAGKNLGKHVDIEEYFNTIEKHEEDIWLKFINFRSDHAVGYRRMKAVKLAKEKGWNVHGRML
ncbi:M48 family metallopeptidase [Oceanivirga salmonicida]|uniref:M48 family metallopeptidase n=1 Tax=Oceanivirga salmonicida TaxID=1769291 RepID=UPI00082FC641|nr:M48 family metallopeptidase [Oceanivirga salmonicida]